MYARDVIQEDIPRVHPLATHQQIAQAMVGRQADTVFVQNQEQKLIGVIRGYDLRLAAADGRDLGRMSAQELMMDMDRLPPVSPNLDLVDVVRLFRTTHSGQLPVVDRGEVLGVVTHANVLDALSRPEVAGRLKDSWERKAASIISALSEGLVVMDRDHVVREFNPAAERLTGRSRAERIGRKAEVVSLEDSPVFRVLATGEALYDIESKLKDGRTWRVNYVPLVEDGEVTGVIQTFRDITEDKRMEEELAKTRDELNEAFALTLPNSKVERKLKTTPEYRDNYDAATGMITITEVIPDGGYRHVVNALKVLADLNRKGIMHLMGMEKDILVQAVIFHDLGKAQPDLEVGQCVNPREAFEPGMAHAERSADFASNFYQKHPDVVTLIRYHHHPEDALEGCPRHLLPMLRVLKLADGLSASITRRAGNITLEVREHSVFVREQNNHPDHCRVYGINVMTGRQTVFERLTMPAKAGATAGGAGGTPCRGATAPAPVSRVAD